MDAPCPGASVILSHEGRDCPEIRASSADAPDLGRSCSAKAHDQRLASLEANISVDELKANGLGVGLLDEMVLNLETGVRTATGETDCEGLS